MEIKYPEIGICGLSCKLCPNYQSTSKSRCLGCKSTQRMAAGCPFISCAIKNKEVEFCWDCSEALTCKKWKEHREASLLHDSFKCYQTLNKDIDFERKNGLQQFLYTQEMRTNLLEKMLKDFDEGRSKSYYCIVATVFMPYEIKAALEKAQTVIDASTTLSIKEKAKLLHSILDEKAKERGYFLKLRK